MNALAGLVELFRQTFKRNCCIDLIPQQSLPCSKVACKQRIHRLSQKMLTVLCVFGCAFHDSVRNERVIAIISPISFYLLLEPKIAGIFDIPLLGFLRPATE